MHEYGNYYKGKDFILRIRITMWMAIFIHYELYLYYSTCLWQTWWDEYWFSKYLHCYSKVILHQMERHCYFCHTFVCGMFEYIFTTSLLSFHVRYDLRLYMKSIWFWVIVLMKMCTTQFQSSFEYYFLNAKLFEKEFVSTKFCKNNCSL